MGDVAAVAWWFCHCRTHSASGPDSCQTLYQKVRLYRTRRAGNVTSGPLAVSENFGTFDSELVPENKVAYRAHGHQQLTCRMKPPHSRLVEPHVFLTQPPAACRRPRTDSCFQLAGQGLFCGMRELTGCGSFQGYSEGSNLCYRQVFFWRVCSSFFFALQSRDSPLQTAAAWGPCPPPPAPSRLSQPYNLVLCF